MVFVEADFMFQETQLDDGSLPNAITRAEEVMQIRPSRTSEYMSIR